MIIDFHAHVFPDALAHKAVPSLARNLSAQFAPVSDGTLSGLLKNMDAWGIDLSVVQPVVTKQSQMKKTNEWAKSICSDRIISFGSIYPHHDNYKKDIDFVAELGFPGLKFHAEYQNFVVDDDKMLRIYDYAFSKGLMILHHAGADPSMGMPYKSSPRQFARIVDAMQGGVMIAAHFGGHDQWEDVETHLAGKNIYLDTSMGFEFFSREQFLRILKKHGADKILFASDSPWSSAKAEMERLNALPITEHEKNAILSGNAKRLLLG